MATRQIPWPRIVAEGVAIVVSILLAFGIQAWWEERRDRIEEVEILRGLDQDFSLYEQRLETFEARARRTMRLLTPLLEAGPPTFGDPPAPAVSDSALYFMSVIATLEATGGTLEALLSSGRMELLQNRHLRAELTSWPNVVSDIRDNELDRRGFDLNIVTPFLVSRGVPLSRVGAVSFDWPTPQATDEQATGIYADLFRDPSFSSIAAEVYRTAANSAQEYAQAKDRAATMLVEIRAELGDSTQ